MPKGCAQPPLRFALQTSQAVFEDGAMRQVMVEARDGYATLRLKGSDKSYTIPWGAVYHAAASRASERELQARRASVEGY